LKDLIKHFTFENNDLTVIEIDGQPWFIAREIGRILEYHYYGKGLIELVSGKWKDEFDEDMLCKMEGEKLKLFKDFRRSDYQTTRQDVDFTRINSLLLLSEQGVYQAVILSKKPVGKKLRKWLAKEVLPSIRRMGQYVDPLKQQSDDPIVQQLRALIVVREEQVRQAEEQKRQAKELEKHAERLNKIEFEKEKVRDAIRQIFKPDEDATPKTIRTQANQIIKTYAFIFAADYKYIYDRMYREHNRREKTNLHVRCKNYEEKRKAKPELRLKKKSKMDFIDEDGKMMKFYAMCYEILMPEIQRKNENQEDAVIYEWN